MKTKTQEAYRQYRDAANKLHDEFVAVAKAEFPIGKRVAWMHGQSQQIGRIIEHRWGEAVTIRNERTGREIWKDAHDLTPVEG